MWAALGLGTGAAGTGRHDYSIWIDGLDVISLVQGDTVQVSEVGAGGVSSFRFQIWDQTASINIDDAAEIIFWDHIRDVPIFGGFLESQSVSPAFGGSGRLIDVGAYGYEALLDQVVVTGITQLGMTSDQGVLSGDSDYLQLFAGFAPLRQFADPTTFSKSSQAKPVGTAYFRSVNTPKIPITEGQSIRGMWESFLQAATSAVPGSELPPMALTVDFYRGVRLFGFGAGGATKRGQIISGGTWTGTSEIPSDYPTLVIADTVAGGVPSAPLSLIGTAGDTVANLSWTAPASNGGSAITNYKVYRNGSLISTLGNVLTTQDTGLINGTTYTYRVTAVNANGEGPLSNQVSVTPSSMTVSPATITRLVTPLTPAVGLPVGVQQLVPAIITRLVAPLAPTVTRAATGSPCYNQLVLLDGPVGYWRLGETAGTNANDEISTADGTYVNGVLLNQTSALTGDSNPSVKLDGTNDYVSLPGAPQFDLGDGPLSLELWIKYSAAPTGVERKLIDKTGSGAYQLILEIDGAVTRVLFGEAGTGGITASTVDITDTNWHHIVATYNGGATGRVYVDGADVSVQVGTQTLVNSAGPIIVGAHRSTTTDFFPGFIDEVAIYNKVLSAAQVAAHYAGAPVSCTGGGGGGALTDAAPGDLQTLIDAAATGSVLSVPAKRYHETISVTRAMTIQGNGSEITGDLTRTQWAVVRADNVAFEDWTMRDAKIGTHFQQGSLDVVGQNFRLQRAHLIKGCARGLKLEGGSGHRIIDVEIEQCPVLGGGGALGSNVQMYGTGRIDWPARIHHNGHAPNVNGTNPSGPHNEGGGYKFVTAQSMPVHDMEFDHNHGPGLWADINVNGSDWYNLSVHHNTYAGLMYEISTNGLIRDSRVWENGWDQTINGVFCQHNTDSESFGWPASILVSSAASVEVRNVVCAWNRVGIGIIYQFGRSDSQKPEVNIFPHDYFIIGESGRFLVTWNADSGGTLFSDNSNRGLNGSYYSLGGDGNWFAYQGVKNLAQFNATNGDTNGAYMSAGTELALLNARTGLTNGIPNQPMPTAPETGNRN